MLAFRESFFSAHQHYQLSTELTGELRYGVESRTAVQEDKERHFSTVAGANEVVVDWQQSCFAHITAEDELITTEYTQRSRDALWLHAI